MREKVKSMAVICLVGFVFFGLSLWNWFGKDVQYSESERRILAKFPELTTETVLNGKFMTNFESYSLDQFPARDSFRTIKAASAFYVFGKKDNNKLYQADSYLSKLEYPLGEQKLEYAAKRFQWIYDNYLEKAGIQPYLSIIPDKNYFLAKENGYLAFDYEKLVSQMKERLDSFSYIDIFPLLSIDDYYRTDTHWRQERILDVAEKIGASMGVTLSGDYTVKKLEHPFYGVYAGQIALPVKPDEIWYCTSDVLDSCIVTSYDSGKPVKTTVYDLKKGTGKDPYELFLGGPDALIEIENPNAATDKELVVFRDSFGSSLTPLLVEAYAKVTVVDIRYIQSAMLGKFIEFDDQDLLFVYNTMVLNNSTILK